MNEDNTTSVILTAETHPDIFAFEYDGEISSIEFVFIKEIDNWVCVYGSGNICSLQQFCSGNLDTVNSILVACEGAPALYSAMRGFVDIRNANLRKSMFSRLADLMKDNRENQIRLKQDHDICGFMNEIAVFINSLYERKLVEGNYVLEQYLSICDGYHHNYEVDRIADMRFARELLKSVTQADGKACAWLMPSKEDMLKWIDDNIFSKLKSPH